MRLAPLISDFNKTLKPSEIAIVVGPEGGFDDNERDYVQTNIEDLLECSIGPRIYRAETAALVALALFQ
jgi:16S rRNA (uracil1498-N3)-methyltransferase